MLSFPFSKDALLVRLAGVRSIASHSLGSDLSRTPAEQLTCSMQSLRLAPMHSDFSAVVRVAGWFETFTVATWKTRTGLEVGICSSTIRSAEGWLACLVQVWLRYGGSEDSC